MKIAYCYTSRNMADEVARRLRGFNLLAKATHDGYHKLELVVPENWTSLMAAEKMVRCGLPVTVNVKFCVHENFRWGEAAEA